MALHDHGVIAPDTAAASLEYTFDGPLPSQTWWTSGKIERRFDNHFRLAKRILQPGSTTAPEETIAYDADGRLGTITTGPTTTTMTATYHAPTGFSTDLDVVSAATR